MGAIPKTKMTAVEYLEFERKSEEKHEYFDGEIFAMAGAKFNHNKIVGNLTGLVWQNLKGKDCSVFPTDMRVLFLKQASILTRI